MNPLVYSVLHVLSGFALVGFTFQAFIAPHPQFRKSLMICTGVASLLMVIAGFGLAAKMNVGFPLWLLIKLGCWLGISLMSGLAFRMPMFARFYSIIALVLIALAVYCAYYKPV